MTTPRFLLSSCPATHYGPCAEPVKMNPATGRWFITMGHPGFNSPANNRAGYANAATAVAALKRYGGSINPKRHGKGVAAG